eukprot:TRINITY_DN19912_c0_g1_i1.p1 TRINITY_DN19912_c0_g1~~TRINITY_DN19912_c0_g1_i1.p1  ORF type:complete len:201 (-),score=53.14 TRINITY_DN19912_c0_g1_i1:131-733(-)
MMEEEEAVNQKASVAASKHIKKRSLRNKALSVSFDDKDLRDYITGFHKRKKRRRKQAERELQDKERRKRIEARKKRKMERELALYGGGVPEENPQVTGSEYDEYGSNLKEDGLQTTTSVSGTKMYDNGDTTIMVTTSELSREDEDQRVVTHFIPKLSGETDKKHSLPVKKKSFKRVMKQKPRKKPKKSASQKRGKKKSRN